ncbi:unnamed protein product, partial [marine sediment metagenome]
EIDRLNELLDTWQAMFWEMKSKRSRPPPAVPPSRRCGMKVAKALDYEQPVPEVAPEPLAWPASDALIAEMRGVPA